MVFFAHWRGLQGLPRRIQVAIFLASFCGSRDVTLIAEKV
jgi:hypothetical protein